MSENGKKCQSAFPKAQYDVFKCQNPNNLLYCLKGEKEAENFDFLLNQSNS